jgi:hypothetical protein
MRSPRPGRAAFARAAMMTTAMITADNMGEPRFVVLFSTLTVIEGPIRA